MQWNKKMVQEGVPFLIWTTLCPVSTFESHLETDNKNLSYTTFIDNSKCCHIFWCQAAQIIQPIAAHQAQYC